MSNMHNPAHPGEVLREYLPEGVSIGQVAKRLGVTRQALSALLNGRAGVTSKARYTPVESESTHAVA
jgi:addiction module HigA family antidote